MTATKKVIPSNFCRKIRLTPSVNPEFVKRQLDWLYQSGHTDRFQTSTTNIRNLQVDEFLAQTVIKLPSVVDQERIVSMLTAFDAHKNSSVAHLTDALRSVKSFRQSVLIAASTGALTADWRKVHEEDADELASDLQQGRSSRRGTIAEAQEDLLEGLPSSWFPATLDLLIERIEAGKSFSALGRPASEKEWGVVKVSAMSWGEFLEVENKAIPPDREINPTYEIKSDDLLISRANTEELVGATVLVGKTRSRLLLSDKSLRLITKPGIDKCWLNFVLRSPIVRAQFSERATGTSDSMRNLSQVKILATTLPLPSVNEQIEIGRRVQALLDIASKTEASVAAVRRQLERSTQSVLAKTFRNE